MASMEHFAIFAQNAGVIKDFYVNVMGLHVVLDNGAGSPPGFFLADDGGMALEIIGRPVDVAAGDTRYLCHIAFTVADVAVEQKRLEAIGLVFEDATAVDTAVMKTAFFRDPDGNRLQIVWRARPLSD